MGYKFTHNTLAAGAQPLQTLLGELKRSPRLLAYLRGPLRGGGRGRERREGGRGGERKEQGKGAEGRKGKGQGRERRK